MLINHHSKPLMTTFKCSVNLLGLKRDVTIKMNGSELSFAVWGRIFGKFEALLKVKADFENVADWNSMQFEVEGTMNKVSTLKRMLENMRSTKVLN